MHQFKLNGYNIVVDTNSGSVHVVDEVAYDLIEYFGRDNNRKNVIEAIQKKYPKESKEEIEECFDDVEELVRENKLYSKDIYEDMVIDFEKKKSSVKALCLHVAHTCNLTCDYCFASQGKFHGERAMMSLEVGKRAIDFLIENSGPRRNLEVDFFGGEPLMNWDMVKEVVKYARSIEKDHNKNFRFTLTTNGVLIDDDVIDFCNKEMHNVVLSLDGRKEIHDRLRRTVNNKGSYDIIVPKFQKFVDKRKGKNYYIRGTFTNENLDFTEDVKHMVDLGFTELSLEPVVTSPGDPAEISRDKLDKIYEEYEKLAKYMLKKKKEGHPINFYHYILDLEGGPCIHKRVTGCGVGTEYYAVTPWGDLYPCHQFVGKKEYKLGDIFRGIEKKDLQNEFKHCNVYAKEECRSCWARLYCSGGCAANALNATGSVRGIPKNSCDIFRKRIECALMMKACEEDMEETVKG